MILGVTLVENKIKSSENDLRSDGVLPGIVSSQGEGKAAVNLLHYRELFYH